ncbi:MAG TPA: hypothetical protein EYN66_05710 [Myxococcales bacterium]|nr:hypothetical protein [Myxococcales bacterium]
MRGQFRTFSEWIFAVACVVPVVDRRAGTSHNPKCKNEGDDKSCKVRFCIHLVFRVLKNARSYRPQTLTLVIYIRSVFFKAKDYVTAGNAICGLTSVVCVIEDQLYWASFLICFAWIFDLADGLVARATNTFNEFGGEFDSLCDHLTYGIAPAALIYAVYSPWMPGEGVTPKVLAAAIAFVLPVMATIRGALFTVKPIKLDGFWVGLPRPASAFVIVCFMNSSLFHVYPEWTFPAAIALILGMAAANLGSIPFMSHHGRVWPRWVSFVIGITILPLPVLLIMGPISLFFGVDLIPHELFFDWMFFLVFGYMVLQWHGAPAKDWQRAKDAIAEWRARELP